MTSEKMNQLMLQRKDVSIRWLYKPPSDSAMDSPNQRYKTAITINIPAILTYRPHGKSFTQAEAPAIVISRATLANNGHLEGPGTK